jgi:hypothetical protein
MDSLDTFLSPNAFNSLLYWTIAVAATAWYAYIYGFPKMPDEENSGKKAYLFVLTFCTPIFVGIGIGAAAYYILYGLSVLFMASIAYIVALLLVVSLFYVTWFLIRLYFKPLKKINPALRTTSMIFSLIIALGFLILSLYVLIIRM